MLHYTWRLYLPLFMALPAISGCGDRPDTGTSPPAKPEVEQRATANDPEGTIGLAADDRDPTVQGIVKAEPADDDFDPVATNRVPIPPDGAALEVRTIRNAQVFLDGNEQPSGQRRFVFAELEAGKRYTHEVQVRLPDGELLKRTVFLQRGWDVILPLARRQIDLELAEQTGHSGGIAATAFSPDGVQLVTVADDHTAILWETASGRQLRVFRGHANTIKAVAFQPDGRRFVTASEDTTAILWDAESGKQLQVFRHEHAVVAAAFHPDGKRMFTSDGEIRVWRLATGEQVRTSFKETGVKALALSPDGKYVLTASSNFATLSFAEFGTGFLRVALEGNIFNDVSSVAFSPDSKQFLFGAYDGKAHLYDIDAANEANRSFQGHTNLVERNRGYSVNALFSPDGTKILTGCADGIAILWDKKTSKQLHAFQGRTEVIFHPREEQVLTVLGTAAILWDARSGEPIRVFKGHTSDATAVAINAKGNQVLAGFADGTAILWDAAEGQRRRVFQAHANWMTAVAFSPDRRFVLTGSDDKTAVLWERQTGQQVRTFVGHTAGVTCLAVSPDGRQLATGSADQSVIVWETATGKQLRVFREHTAAVAAVAFDAEGNSLLTGSADHTAIVWDLKSGRKIRDLKGHTEGVTAAAFSRDGKFMLTGGDDKQAILWDRSTSLKVHSFLGHTDGVNAVAFSSDGKHVATGAADKKAILWETTSGRRLGDFVGHTDSVSSVAFTPDGRRLLTGSWDRSAILWDLDTRSQLRAFVGHAEPVTGVALSPDGLDVLTSSFDGVAILWETETGRPIRELHEPSGSVGTAVFRPDDKQVITAAYGSISTLWDSASGAKLRAFNADAEGVLAWGHRTILSPSNRHLLTTSGRSATVWDLETGKAVATCTSRDPIVAAAFSHDGMHVLTCGDPFKSELDLWKAATGKVVRSFKTDNKKVSQLLFTPKGSHFLAGTEDGSVLVWDLTSGQVVRTLEGPSGGVAILALSPDGQILLSGSWERGAVLRDFATGAKLRELPGRMPSVAFAPNGRHVLTGLADGTARLWDIATGDELCRLINIDNGEDWAVVTPDGLFDGTRSGREKIAFRIGAGLNVVPLDRFFQDCYYPSLLAEIWRGERPMPGKPLQLSPAPLVKMLVKQNEDGAQNNQVVVDVAVTNQGGGVKGPWLQHNGATLPAGKLLRLSDRTTHYRFRVALVPGDNRIEARAATANGGVESEAAVASIKFDGKLPEPDLYAIVIGINRFAKDAGVADLDCCVTDAQSIADLFREHAGKFYGKIHVTPLFDEQATKANILKAVTDLSAKARPQDAMLLFVASHGYTVGQRFYLFPHDFRLDKAARPTAPVQIEGIGMRGYRGADEEDAAVRQHGLAIDELGEALAVVPALKRVLIFDTCHSGSAIALAGKKLNPFAFRGAMERFSRAQGVYSLAATSADELAAENNKELGHSILTYALLAGAGSVSEGPLKAEAARRRTAGAVDVLEWFRFAKERVPGLYEKYVGRRQQVELSGDDQPSFPLLTLKGK
jgi:WD40 repeat protein/uncharacterized caspase-like protein